MATAAADFWHALPGPLRRRVWTTAEISWKYTPRIVRRATFMESLGFVIHRRVRTGRRFQSSSTKFLRNRPQLALVARLSAERIPGETLRIVSLGCSTGAEVYSLLHALRCVRDDIRVAALGVDYSKAAIEKAKQGVYAFWDPEMTGLSADEMKALFFDRSGFKVVRDHLVRGASWRVADVCDPALLRDIGPRDIVMINNLLIHFDETVAGPCLLRVLDTVAPGGLLVLSGVDLDLKERIMRESGFQAVTDEIRAVHHGDPAILDEWPWRYWGLEPFDAGRSAWEYRYSTVFRKPAL